MMRWKRKALWSIRSCGIFTTKSPTAKCEKMLCMHLLLPSSTNRRGRTIPSSFGFLPRLLRCSDHHSFPGGCLSAADTQPAPQPGYLAGTGMGLILCNMILRPPVGSMCPYDFLEQYNGVYIKLLIDGLLDNYIPSGVLLLLSKPVWHCCAATRSWTACYPWLLSGQKDCKTPHKGKI